MLRTLRLTSGHDMLAGNMNVVRPIACRFLLLSLVGSATVYAQAPGSLSSADREEIQALVAGYAQALAGCRAAEFADLFVPETGYFASGFRGQMTGRERLVALVESERQCATPNGKAGSGKSSDGKNAKARAATAPTVTLEVSGGAVKGIVNLGTAEYQDEYVKTAQGWRFASRTVVIAAEKAAGLDADAMLAIQRLGGGDKLGDHYEPDQNGVPRLMTSGVRIGISNNQVTGRAYLKSGGYDEQIYERAGTGEWRMKASTHVP